MAQHNTANNNNNNNNIVIIVSQQQQQQKMFHDFLGMKNNNPKTSSTTVSRGAATSADRASERQARNHLEGVPFYGTRSDFSSIEISNRLVGNKRSNSDSTFMGSSRDSFQMVPDSLQNSHLMKMLRNRAGAGADRLGRPKDDEVFLGMQSLKPASGSQILQTDANKWEQQSILMNVGPSMQHPPRGGRLTPFMDQITSNRMRDHTNAGPSFVSRLAADEGSRTGIKGAGILSSINTVNAVTEKTSSMLGGSRPKPVTNIVDPESSTPLNRRQSASASCKMTVFYGGQAHVFDDVQPNKADVIMALAGSNGGSWSTALSPKSSVKLHHDNNSRNGANETVIVSNVSLPPDRNRRLSITSSSSHAIRPGDQATTPTGAHQGSIVAKNTPSSELR